MKVIKILLFGALSIAVSFSACKQDNYAAPDAGIQGSIIDALTGAKVPTEQPNGTKIRLIETKYAKNATPNDFWCKPDGSFISTVLFATQYKVIPIEGAFFPADTATVSVSGNTQIDLKVTPFLTIKATVTPVSKGLSVTYTIARSKIGDKIVSARTLVSAFPAVSNRINEFNKINDLTGVPDNTVLATTYTDAISGLTSGKTYYVRVAARTANANSKFNYTEIVKVTIP